MLYQRFGTYRHWIAFPLLLLAFASIGRCQSEDQGSIPILNAKLGFGVNYGGLGLNLEYGKDAGSVFAVVGYAWESTKDRVVIEPSVNFALGARYHLRIRNEFVTPHAGLQVGWVTNYYNPQIGEAEYDQTVYGLSAHVGTEFLTETGVTVNIDINFNPDFANFNQSNHPFYFGWYIRPSIGIGYDFSSLFYRERTQRKRKKRQEFDFTK